MVLYGPSLTPRVASPYGSSSNRSLVANSNIGWTFAAICLSPDALNGTGMPDTSHIGVYGWRIDFLRLQNRNSILDDCVAVGPGFRGAALRLARGMRMNLANACMVVTDQASRPKANGLRNDPANRTDRRPPKYFSNPQDDKCHPQSLVGWCEERVDHE